MGLMSRSLLVLLGALTVALPVVTVMTWSRFTRGGPVRRHWGTLGRFGLVLASQLVAVMLVAAAVNDYGYFFGSWSSLWSGLDAGLAGARSSPLTVQGLPHRAAGPVSAGGVLQVRTYPGFSTPRQWATRGHLETVRIRGPVSGLSSQAFVYLPPEYYQARYAGDRFPAALALTGYPGNDKMLVARMHYQTVLRRDLRRHQARPMVLVMMQPAVTYPRDTECTDVPSGPQVETFLAQDVPSEVAHHYRVLPSGWGVIGDSTGGYCATKLALAHPAAFPAAASLSGYYNALEDRSTGNLWGGSAMLRKLNSPLWRLTHLPPPPVSLLLTSSRGETGPEGLPNLDRFLRLVRPPLAVSTIIAPEGGHNFYTWEPQLPAALDWLSARLPRPAPG